MSAPDVFEVDTVEITADDGSATLAVIWWEPGQMMARLKVACRWHPCDDRIEFLGCTSPDVDLMQAPLDLARWVESDRTVERLFRDEWRDYAESREP